MDVNEVIREIIGLLRAKAGRQSISLDTDLAADLPTISADRVQVQQVLMNLMLNVIDAIHQRGGAGELAIRTRPTPDQQVLISVSDTGVGLLPSGRKRSSIHFLRLSPKAAVWASRLAVLSSSRMEAVVGHGQFRAGRHLPVPPARRHQSGMKSASRKRHGCSRVPDASMTQSTRIPVLAHIA